ncbi:MAG: 3-isopropylmalate dehydrogenase [Candidatus Promineifilaceae bacterium]|nr:3-isopropylmalate dehydrogenase [Candidatus Promineifilaceae bacterium]
MDAHLIVLPGDGIGPEVIQSACEVMQAVANAFGHDFSFETQLIGGAAIDQTGHPLPEQTVAACRDADGVLLGAVGGPKWDDPTAAVRPEQGLLGIRQALSLYANLRPIKPSPQLLDASPLRRERLQGVDLLVVRELTGGIYFGQPRERRLVEGEVQAVDTMLYRESEIRRVARLAFEAAKNRRGRVASVDKANVLENSRLWRQTVTAVSAEYEDVTLEHLLVDAAAMHLLTRPSSFDVIVTGNLFGDILTDEASVLSGSLGNLPSASLGASDNRHGRPRGLFEPIHGSAPDIAGQGLANPIGTILSAAMLLRHSLGLVDEARVIERAVEQTLSAGQRTADLARDGERAVGTADMTGAIIAALATENA